MDIIYSTKKLNKTLTHQTKLVRKYGPQQARAISTRLYELDIADTLAEIGPHPPPAVMN